MLLQHESYAIALQNGSFYNVKNAILAYFSSHIGHYFHFTRLQKAIFSHIITIIFVKKDLFKRGK